MPFPSASIPLQRLLTWGYREEKDFEVPSRLVLYTKYCEVTIFCLLWALGPN